MRVSFTGTEREEILEYIRKDLEERVGPILDFECLVRSVLSYWGTKDEAIDSLIKDDVYLNAMKEKEMTTLEEWTDKQARFILEQKRQVMEATAENLLEHAFRGDNMCDSATAEPALKDFAVIVKTLTQCKEVASQLSTRSRNLVSAFTGISKPPEEETEKLKVDSVVLVHVLRDIEGDLSRSLNEISDNLDKLENAW